MSNWTGGSLWDILRIKCAVWEVVLLRFRPFGSFYISRATTAFYNVSFTVTKCRDYSRKMQEPGGSAETKPSESLEIEHFQRTNDEMKGDLTNALIYCESLLESKNLIVNTPPEQMSSASIAMGDEIFKEIACMLEERKLITDEELIVFEESDNEGEYEQCKDEPDESPDYTVVQFDFEVKADYVSLSYKEKTVALAEAHPKWSLQTLQRRGCSRLRDKRRLSQWKEDVKRGGTMIDKWKHIETETFERFKEAREYLEQVTTRTLQQWAMAAAFPFLSNDFTFSASNTWVKKFKQKYRIKQKKIIKYGSSREYATLEETVKAAERFKIQTRAIIPDFDLNFVINTDQIGCQYQAVYNRTLAAQRSESVVVKKKSLSNITHFYTAQYAITASGKILPLVFLCMQEMAGRFNFFLKQKIDKLASEFKNVIVTCSKSGKLTKELYIEFLKRSLSSYVNKNKFLLIVDSWEGQIDPVLYDNIFEEENGKASCTIKVIPSKCTTLCQPCDVYFYRQVKNIMKRLQTAPALLKQQREIATREDAIKIHSLVLHQLSAPVFVPMIQYAWFASKLITERPIFMNVNDICFPLTNLKIPCSCNDVSFIQCAWCKLTLCFKCFYDDYHPRICTFPEKDSEEDSNV